MNYYEIHTHWGYSGTEEDILNRHDPHIDNIPPHFPRWSDKQWKSIWHQHYKALRVIEMTKKEQEENELAQARNTFVKVLRAVHQYREDRHLAHIDQQSSLALRATLKSRNNTAIAQSFSDNKSLLATESDEKLIWLLYVTRFGVKQHKKGSRTRKHGEIPVMICEAILTERNIPIKGTEFKDLYDAIDPKVLEEFRKSVIGFLS
jgi:hypothetical protein